MNKKKFTHECQPTSLSREACFSPFKNKQQRQDRFCSFNMREESERGLIIKKINLFVKKVVFVVVNKTIE
jgi:hypothetical protein